MKVLLVIISCLVRPYFGFSYIPRIFSGRIWSSFIYDTVSFPVSSKILCASICQANKGTCQLFVMDGSVCHLGIYVCNNTFLAPQTTSNVVNIDSHVFKAASDILLVVGGSRKNGIGSVEALDMSRLNRTCPPIAGIPTIVGGTGTFLDGQAISCGGNPTADRCYSYNSNSDHWNEMAVSLSTIRRYPAGIKLSESEFWVTGGWGKGEIQDKINSTEIYDGTYSNFTDSFDLPVLGIGNHNMIDLNATHIFICGLQSTEAYLFDKPLQTFIPLPDLQKSRHLSHAGTVKLSNGSNYVVVAGGIGENTTEWWNLDREPRWVFGPPLPVVKLHAGESVPYWDTFLIVGGITDTRQSTITYFDIDSNDWKIWPQRLSLGYSFATAFMVPNSYIHCT